MAWLQRLTLVSICVFAVVACILYRLFSYKYTYPPFDLYAWETYLPALPLAGISALWGFFAMIKGKDAEESLAQGLARRIRNGLLQSKLWMSLCIGLAVVLTLGCLFYIPLHVPLEYPRFVRMLLDSETVSEPWKNAIQEIKKEDAPLAHMLDRAGSIFQARDAIYTAGTDIDQNLISSFIKDAIISPESISDHPLIIHSLAQANVLLAEERYRLARNERAPVVLHYRREAKKNFDALAMHCSSLAIPDLKYASLANQGNEAYHFRDFKKAAELWHSALKVPDRTRPARLYINLVAAYVSLGELGPANEAFRNGLRQVEEDRSQGRVWSPLAISYLYQNRGYASLLDNKPNDALTYFKKGREFANNPMASLDIALAHVIGNKEGDAKILLDQADKALLEEAKGSDVGQKKIGRCISLVRAMMRDNPPDKRRSHLSSYLADSDRPRLRGKELVSAVLEVLDYEYLPCESYPRLPSVKGRLSEL